MAAIFGFAEPGLACQSGLDFSVHTLASKVLGKTALIMRSRGVYGDMNRKFDRVSKTNLICSK
ncbi:hypothetical protein EYB58_17285 [Desulfobacter hydrogenophilus]|nr:hypothetical protein [Desulfobacter hydrogenophilus]QBH14524.1 hypothetical protein EYB58_17285 [Desulfobacter hydrogenophilus]